MSKEDKFDPLALVSKLAEAEQKLFDGTFLAPVVDGARVRIRVHGIIYELTVEEKFEGWALLRITKPGRARVIEAAPPTLVARYLKLFARVRLILVQQFDARWFALAASNSDSRFRITGPVPLHLVQGAKSFDTVYARFDGSAFWFETVDRRRDPAVSRTLNDALKDKVKPEDLHCRGVVPQERLAYRMLWLARYGDDAIIPADDVTRVGTALKHAGAALVNFTYQGNDRATVLFTVDGTTRNVSIRPSDLTVLSAGICLSDRDGDFDLTSLVGVFREAMRSGEEY
jgi:hypothetical protein